MMNIIAGGRGENIAANFDIRGSLKSHGKYRKIKERGYQKSHVQINEVQKVGTEIPVLDTTLL